MGYIVGAYAKNSVATFPIALLAVSDGEAAVAPTIEAGDFKVSTGGAFANLATLPTVSPAGGRQIVVALGTGETPGPWTTVQFVDQTAPKVYHDNFWTMFLGNVSSTSGSVNTINPSAVVDAEQIANLVGPYLVNLFINTVNLPTAEQWDDIVGLTALINAIKAKTDQFGFTSGRVNANLGAIEAAVQTIIKSLVFTSLADSGNTLSELTAGALPITPTLTSAITALYMALRNGTIATATSPTTGTRILRNAAGTTITTASMSKGATTTDTGKLDS